MGVVEFNAVIVVAVVVLVVVRQFTVRPVTPRMYIWVALLVARGCVPPGPARLTPAGVVVLAASLAVSVGFGYVRGRAMPVWRDGDGGIWRRGGRVVFLLWLATLAARVVVDGFGQVVLHEPFNLDALWLGFGVTLAVQHFVTGVRGRRLPVPTAPPPGIPVRT